MKKFSVGDVIYVEEENPQPRTVLAVIDKLYYEVGPPEGSCWRSNLDVYVDNLHKRAYRAEIAYLRDKVRDLESKTENLGRRLDNLTDDLRFHERSHDR